ncbi:UNVERIFIED_CONTAM: Small heat shock protein, chloroplastic [Sesamum latifolium]|uniref:Small heat shock protein, chloroplastic n=1 Tax=Sesamum latifolium TaxID=2727402 RepID=A0AAW2X073_9LAMI
MSQCLSNLSISHPISSQTALFPHNPSLFQSRSSHFLRTPISGRNRAKNVVRAVAAEGRDNLDHLQRSTKQQPRKRSAPVAPTANDGNNGENDGGPFAYSGGWPSPLPPADSVGYSRGRTPWEIKEAETEYKMRFDMPGMTKEDVKVWVEEKMLVVKAEKSSQKGSENEEENGEDWSPKSYGKYSSRIALPENVQFEKIKAEVKDGVLYITIPKASSSAKIFDINVE